MLRLDRLHLQHGGKSSSRQQRQEHGERILASSSVCAARGRCCCCWAAAKRPDPGKKPMGGPDHQGRHSISAPMLCSTCSSPRGLRNVSAPMSTSGMTNLRQPHNRMRSEGGRVGSRPAGQPAAQHCWQHPATRPGMQAQRSTPWHHHSALLQRPATTPGYQPTRCHRRATGTHCSGST